MEKYLIAKGGVYPDLFESTLIRVGDYNSYQDAFNEAEAWAHSNAYDLLLTIDDLIDFDDEWVAVYEDSLMMEVIKGSEIKKSDLDKISESLSNSERKEFMEFFEKVLEIEKDNPNQLSLFE